MFTINVLFKVSRSDKTFIAIILKTFITFDSIVTIDVFN